MVERDARLAVAQALTAATEGGSAPAWEALDEETQGELLQLAGVAIAAHCAWCEASGVRLVPPQAVVRPASEPEARAMIRAGEAFLQGHARKAGLVGGPGLVVPPGVRRH